MGEDALNGTAVRALTWIGRGVVVAFVAALAVLVWRDPLYYFYDDALFYLQIGRSVAHGHGAEFTPGIPTNGYHPFWMLWCAGVAALSDTRWHQLVATAWLVVAMNAAWVLAAWRVFSRYFPEPMVLAGIAVGAGYVFFYSFGMESPLALLCMTLCLGATLAHERSPSRRALVAAALCAGLTVFARLDQAVTLAPVMAWLAWRDWRARRDLGGLALAAIAGAVLPVAWLTYNKLTFGAFTPISGMLKMRSAEGGVLPPASGVVYLFLTIAVAAALLSALRREAPGRGTVIAAGAGHLGYFAYLTFAGNEETWGWYFAVLAGNMALFVPAVMKAMAAYLGWPQLRKGAIVGALTGSLAFGGLLFAKDARPPNGLVLADFVGPGSVAAKAREQHVDKILVFDRPGVFAFLGGLNVYAADGLTTNLEFQRRLSRDGIRALITREGIGGLVVANPIFRQGRICGMPFLGTELICEPNSGEVPRASAVRFYSRLDGRGLGVLALRREDQVPLVPSRDYDFYRVPQP